MPQRLSTADGDFERKFQIFLGHKREVSDDVDVAVRSIIADVRRRGDRALIELTAKFDRLDLEKVAVRVATSEIEAAHSKADNRLRAALELARDRITTYHERQRPRDDCYVDQLGAELGCRWTPVESVGLYTPGGQASYPSSVLMNAIPAKVAGISRIAMAVPAMCGELNWQVLAAAHVAGIDEIYRIGGAQAIAAFAFGTESIAPVTKIVGPGNAYVAAAKRQVFGSVGIDSIAGPTEVLIIADANNDPHWIAADLLAQAEHDASAQPILMTDDAKFAVAVEAAVTVQLEQLPRATIAAESWRTFGAIIQLRALNEAPALADRIAAEHVQIATQDPEALANRIRNAGAIFLGAHTPEVIGDYVAGTNHVLPTARGARYCSGLGVLDFMKRTSIVKLAPRALASLSTAAMTLASAEGLEGHRRSVAIRLKAER
jgi:histidinol dehydrogenase